MKSPLSWMMALAFAAIVPAGSALASGGPYPPRPVSADPALVARLGPAAVARLSGGAYPERELYLESSDARKASGPAKIAGTGRCLVVLVQWADHPADVGAHPQSDYDAMMFSTGTWATGSMNDFYLENSYGQYGVQGLVSGWHTATVPYANIDPTDYAQVRSMIAAVMQQLDPVIDYSQYDDDGPDGVPDSGDDDGIVDSFFFVHAGPGREQTGDAGDIWSHAWAFSQPLATADGVSLKRYSVEPEMLTDGSLITVGVFCHEYGHVLGLPDLYDVDYTSSGIGDWGLMSGGSWGRGVGEAPGSSPSHFCAWSKQRLGWITPVAITADAYGVSIPPVESTPTAYRVFRGGAATGDEYFLVENRRAVGFDRSLTRRQVDLDLPLAEGLAIYHVDDAVETNSDERHRLVDVVEASPWFRSATDWIENLDGPREYALQFWLSEYNRGDNGDLWPGWSTVSADSSDWVGPRDRDRFADDTIPPAEDHECDPTGVAIENITPAGDDVLADFVLGAKRIPVATPDKTLDWNFETGTEGWSFCRSYAHRDTLHPGSCSGGGGLWFGVDDSTFVCGPGYGNSWHDFATTTVGVTTGAMITLRHRYDIESDYDHGYVEVRCAGDPDAPWQTVAVLTGASTCVTDTWAIPGSAIDACANTPGAALLDLRLRLETDGGWSAEDGNFCGIGWWIDEISIDGEYAVDAGDPPAAGLRARLEVAPNPFNPATVLRYRVPEGARDVRLSVFDERGRRVRGLTATAEPGWREARWDGRDDAGRALASGVYFARLDVDGKALVEKLALLR